MKSEYVDQRTLFVDSLYSHLKKEEERARTEYSKFASSAYNYITSGLSESEAVELLIVDGVDRDAARSYVTMAKDMGDVNSDGEQEYSFVFEDVYGNTFTSHDIDRTIFASSQSEAFTRACELIGDDNQFAIQSILSVEKI